jgi:hypothetical protein
LTQIETLTLRGVGGSGVLLWVEAQRAAIQIVKTPLSYEPDVGFNRRRRSAKIGNSVGHFSAADLPCSIPFCPRSRTEDGQLAWLSRDADSQERLLALL